MAEDIQQEADWIKQYYVTVNSSLGGNVTSFSDWVDEKTLIILEAKGEENYQFMGWSGIGDASYTGSKNNYSLIITSPVNETAHWKKIFRVAIESEFPVEGLGQYLDGESVELLATESEGLLIRKIFQKWSGDIDSTSNPFIFTITRDMEIAANYTVNYTYFVVVILVLLITIGIAVYLVVSKMR